MESKIFLSKKVENKDRRFGSATEYYPAMVEDPDGIQTPALFTSAQIEEAQERAVRNPEDIPGEESFWGRLFG